MLNSRLMVFVEAVEIAITVFGADYGHPAQANDLRHQKEFDEDDSGRRWR